MEKRKYLLLVGLAIVAGLMGGAVSNWVFAVRPAIAQVADKKESVLEDPLDQSPPPVLSGQRLTEVVAAREFRLIDGKGNIKALLKLSYDGIPILELYMKDDKTRVISLDSMQASSIQSVSSDSTSYPAEHESDIIAENLEVKLIDSKGRYSKYSWRLVLKNNTSRNLMLVSGHVEFQDSDGFVIDKAMFVAHLNPLEEKAITGTKIVEDADQVSRYKVRFSNIAGM